MHPGYDHGGYAAAAAAAQQQQQQQMQMQMQMQMGRQQQQLYEAQVLETQRQLASMHGGSGMPAGGMVPPPDPGGDPSGSVPRLRIRNRGS